MRVAKEQVDIKMAIPGAVIRQRRDFGDASGYSKISGEYFTLAAGVDTTRYSRGWKETSVNVPIGASCCVVSSPRPMRPASRRQSAPMICSIGRLGTT